MAQGPRAPVPPENARSQAIALLQEIYRPEYQAAKTQQDRSELAQKIVTTADETNDDPVARYVMLRVATDIAVQAADVDTAMECVKKMATYYDIDEFEMRASALTSVAGRLTRETEGAMLPRAADLCRESIEAQLQRCPGNVEGNGNARQWRRRTSYRQCLDQTFGTDRLRVRQD
jgi:hypothetical protein